MRRYLFTLLTLIVLVPSYGQQLITERPWYAFIKCKAMIEQQHYDSALLWADTGMERAEEEFGKTTDEYVFFLHNKNLAFKAANQRDQIEPMYNAYYEELKIAPTDSALINHLRIKTFSETMRKVGVEEVLRTMTLMKSKLGKKAQNLALSAFENPEADSRRWTTILAFVDLGGEFQQIDQETEENKSLFKGTPLESTANDVFGSISLFKKGKKTKETLNEHNNPEDSVERPKIGIRAFLGAKEEEDEEPKEENPLIPQFVATGVNYASLSEAQIDSLEAKVVEEYILKKQQRDTSQSIFSNVIFATTALGAGVFYENVDRITQADTCFARANEGFHNYMSEFSLLVGQEDKMRSVSDFYAFSNYANSFVLRHYREYPSITGLAYNNILLEKGQLLEKNRFMQQAVTNSDDEYLLRVYDLWIDAKNIVAATNLEEMKDDEVRNYIDSVKFAMQELKKELNRQTQFENQQQWVAIRENLSAGEAVVEFLHFPYYEKGKVLQNSEEEEEKVTPFDSIYYAAVVMRPEDEYPHIVPLCKEADIIELVKGEESETIANQLYRGAGAVKTSLSKGDQLYDLIWKPLEPLLNESETVHFSPTGQLHKVSFAGLPSPDGALVERYQLHHLGSTRLLAFGSVTKPVNTNSAALFGDINFNANPDELLAMAESENLVSYGNAFVYKDKEKEEWKKLDGTLYEVEAIANLLNDKQTQYDYFTGSSAMEERFKKLGDRRAESPGIVHVATHGFFLANSETEKKKDKEEDEELYDPTLALRRSGLVFAGGNNAWMGKKNVPEDIDDGILLASEAAQMSLQNTDLIVLSACETGLGDITNSEGVYGLQRAIREAGVRYLVMSLWSVDDEVAKFTMQRFYDLLIDQKKPVSTAFNQAQQEARQRFNDNPDWAAFTLVE
ncbi:CHAT domain-containing protein [Catalinimonas sp. 4WD22]|uniref:CHAT domain-containing protein n=1 Tax=Catalinimonas locisalis TaxID=3133978 RepID=UPI0031014E54